MPTLTADDDDESTLDGLLLRWEEHREEGLHLSAEELAGGRADLTAELRRRIEALLRLEALEASRAGASGGAGADPPRARPSAPDESRSISSRAEFGRLRFHAEGGLGEIFLARNAELKRDVALKFLKKSRAADPTSRRRFLAEAEVTGRLEHPGIVPVYALGLDAEGVPCYAMRFIRGRTFHDAIREYHESGTAGPRASAGIPALRALLKRFVSICNTVAYAHSRGVLHRDLKPRNVMLGPFEETLVVDWGLARSGGPAEGDGGSDLDPIGATRAHLDISTAGSVVGTPQYMSPEQAAGAVEVGPPSDIFALGAMLYAVLTGRPPFEGRNIAELLGRASRADYPRPRSILPEIPRALEAVCLKAMAFRPADRYEGALDLAADVDRWIADEPVTAWREPWSVRVRRWITRNRSRMVAGSAVVVAAVAIPVAVSIVQARSNRDLGVANGRLKAANRETAEQRDAARKSSHRAEAVLSFIIDDVLVQADPRKNSRDRRITVVEALDRAAGRLGGQFTEAPLTEAAVREAIGLSYQSLGEYAKAEPFLVASLGLRAANLAEGQDDLLASRGHLGALRLAQGRHAEAESFLQEVWEARLRANGPEAAPTLQAQNDLAVLRQEQRRFPEAESLMRGVLGERTRTLGDEHPDTIRTLANLAVILANLGKSEEAETIERTVLRARRKTLPPSDPSVILAMNNLASTLYNRGKLDEAAPLAGTSAKELGRILGEDHPTTLTSLFNLAMISRDSNRPDEALPLLRRCLEGRRLKFGADDLETVATEFSLAELRWNLGRMEGVEEAYRHIVRVRLDKLGPSSPLTMKPANDLAVLLMTAGNAAEAEPILRRLVPATRQDPGRSWADLGNTLLTWGSSLLSLDRHAEAEAPIREGKLIREATQRPGSPGIASAGFLLGASLVGQGRWAEGGAMLAESYPALEGTPYQRNSLNQAIRAYRRSGDPDGARAWRARLGELSFPADPFLKQTPDP